MSKGWIKLHRSTFDNDLWTAEPFTKGQAWIDLIGHANHRPASIWIRGIEVNVNRGQLAWSELTMAKRWQWSRGKVRRYLGMLESRCMVVQQTNKLTTILTICKYEVYQTEQTTDETPNGTTGRTTDGQQTDNRRYTNKNDKNVKNDEKKDIPPKSPKGDNVDFSVWPQQPTDQTMKDWQAMRKKKKATISQTVVNRMAGELEKAVSQGYTVDECLQECVLRNWQGFKAEWMKGSMFGGQPNQPQRKQPKDFDFGG